MGRRKIEGFHLAEGEYRFAEIVWQNEPMKSGQLVALAESSLGWKKSTTYTVLRKLCGRGILQNENGFVTSRITREEARRMKSAAVVEQAFDGSLPQFVAAFVGSSPISPKEAAEIRAILEEAERGL